MSIYTTISMGVTIFPDDGNTVSEVLKNADTAMYEAKQNGKNNFYFFNKNMTTTIMKKKAIEINLRDALNKEEFRIVYQPQIDIKTRKIKGFEALLRWNNNELGAVSPIEFIPIAERTGFIGIIGEWVLTTACRQIKEWKDKGYEFDTIAVNLSPVQTTEKRFFGFN